MSLLKEVVTGNSIKAKSLEIKYPGSGTTEGRPIFYFERDNKEYLLNTQHLLDIVTLKIKKEKLYTGKDKFLYTAKSELKGKNLNLTLEGLDYEDIIEITITPADLKKYYKQSVFYGVMERNGKMPLPRKGKSGRY